MQIAPPSFGIGAIGSESAPDDRDVIAVIDIQTAALAVAAGAAFIVIENRVCHQNGTTQAHAHAATVTVAGIVLKDAVFHVHRLPSAAHVDAASLAAIADISQELAFLEQKALARTEHQSTATRDKAPRTHGGDIVFKNCFYDRVPERAVAPRADVHASSRPTGAYIAAEQAFLDVTGNRGAAAKHAAAGARIADIIQDIAPFEKKLAAPSAGKVNSAAAKIRLIILDNDVGEEGLSIASCNFHRSAVFTRLSALEGEIRDREINWVRRARIHVKDAIVETRVGIDDGACFARPLNSERFTDVQIPFLRAPGSGDRKNVGACREDDRVGPESGVGGHDRLAEGAINARITSVGHRIIGPADVERCGMGRGRANAE